MEFAVDVHASVAAHILSYKTLAHPLVVIDINPTYSEA